MVGAALVSGLDVVDFEEAGTVAAGGLAAVVVAGRHLASHAGRDGCGVATALGADRRVAAHSLGFGAAELSFAGMSLDGHAAG